MSNSKDLNWGCFLHGHQVHVGCIQQSYLDALNSLLSFTEEVKSLFKR